MQMNILVIDDDIDYTDMMRMRLESWGHTATVANNWLSAMMQAGRNAYDLMLIDIETPTGNGLTACEDLCQNPKIDATPKVFITGCSDDASIQRCHELNAKYIHKSSNVFDELLQVIAELEASRAAPAS